METGRPIRVLICDTTRMSAEALARSLRDSTPFIEVCGWTSCGHETSELAKKVAPDVGVIALMLATGLQAGLAVIEDLQRSAPTAKAVLLVDEYTLPVVVDAFRAGAKGILDRSRDLDALCRCITAVAEGEIWAGTKEIGYLIDAIKATSRRIVNSKGERLLSSREEEVRALVEEGLSNRDIAATMKLSEHTVKNYMFHIFDKLGVSNRVELILYAQRHIGESDLETEQKLRPKPRSVLSALSNGVGHEQRAGCPDVESYSSSASKLEVER